jgi:hypothetical protein
VGRDGPFTNSREPSVYRRLNEVLARHGFDDFVETECAAFCATPQLSFPYGLTSPHGFPRCPFLPGGLRL